LLLEFLFFLIIWLVTRNSASKVYFFNNHISCCKQADYFCFKTDSARACHASDSS